MRPLFSEFGSFYESLVGRVVRRFLMGRMRDLWPDLHGMQVVGLGYAMPYLSVFSDEAERGGAVVFGADEGLECWPSDGLNVLCLGDEGALPFETNSVDRVILVHGVEFSHDALSAMEEVWRILKSEGRLLLIVPHRGGFWSRADHTVFGRGVPYSRGQVRSLLEEALFIPEVFVGALYFPAAWARFKWVRWIEALGARCFPFMAGVQIVEARKQLYASSVPSSGSKVGVRAAALKPTEGISLKDVD